MKLYMVRHGETGCNVQRVYYGSLDVPITEKGRRQAEAVGDMLRNVDFDQIIVSGLCRTRQTAEAILSRQGAERRQIWSVPAFDEINFGAWEGLHYTEVRERYPEDYRAMAGDWLHCGPTDGENFMDFSRRVWAGWKALSSKDAFKKAEKVLLVGHSGPMQCLMCHFLGMDVSNIWHLEIRQGVYTEFEIVDNFPVLKGLNVTC